jgi:hypothetical protein
LVPARGPSAPQRAGLAEAAGVVLGALPLLAAIAVAAWFCVAKRRLQRPEIAQAHKPLLAPGAFL